VVQRFSNGAYSDWVNGRQFCDVMFWKRLWRAYAVGRPYLAVVPDIPAQGLYSLEYSLWWVERLPVMWPWYLAVQDGMTVCDVEPVIGRFAGVFLGGTDDFKLTASAWCSLAHRHQKKFHYARAGIISKIRHAVACGADSIDSAYAVFEQDRFDRWIEAYDNNWYTDQIELFEKEAKNVCH
jgi:hypothetical protein